MAKLGTNGVFNLNFQVAPSGGEFRTNTGSVIWPKMEPMECLTCIFLSSKFACFVAGKIIQVIEAMPGSVVPLAMIPCESDSLTFSPCESDSLFFLLVRATLFGFFSL